MSFYVKCNQCGRLYDSSHQKCPYDQCERITKRIFWTNKDFETERYLKSKDRGLNL